MADTNYTNTSYSGHVYSQHMGEEDIEPAEPFAPPGPTFLGKATNVLGAIASLALIIGVGVWGYKLIVRDVSGVPVVRALEGPMRIQPDNPGGLQADNQGLSVNEVAATGAASPTADRLVLAPRPVELNDEDKPAAQANDATQATEGAGTDTGTNTGTGALETMDVNALVEQLTAGVAPLSDEQNPIVAPLAPGNEPAPQDGDGEIQIRQNQEANFDAPDLVEQAQVNAGLDRSLRPQARPARFVVSSGAASSGAVLASAINAAVDTVARVEIDPESLAVGTRLAQLGAYDSIEIARSEWNRLNGRFEQYMDGKQRVIQQAKSGGRTFYRLRALGFVDLSDARRFCSALIAENTDCIPVTIR